MLTLIPIPSAGFGTGPLTRMAMGAPADRNGREENDRRTEFLICHLSEKYPPVPLFFTNAMFLDAAIQNIYFLEA